MSTIARQCKQFQAHVWRKDVCANCKRSAAEHTPTADQAKPRDAAATEKVTVKDKPRAKPTDKVGKAQSSSAKAAPKVNSSRASTLGSNRTPNCSAAAAAAAGKRDACIDRTSKPRAPGVDKGRVEQALKTLTAINNSPAAAGHKSKGSAAAATGQYKSTASRTTMSYSDHGKRKSGPPQQLQPTVTSANSEVSSPSAANNQATSGAVNACSSEPPTPAAAAGQRLLTAAHSSNNGQHHHHTASSNVKSTNSASSKPSLPLDKNVSKLTACRDVANANTAVSGASTPVGSKSDAAQRNVEKRTGGALNKVSTSKVIEKRKSVIDKGRLSTEKVIVNESTIVTTTQQSARTKAARVSKTSDVSKKADVDRARASNKANGAKYNATAKAEDERKIKDESRATAAMDSNTKPVTSDTQKQPVPGVYNRTDSGTSVDSCDGRGTTSRRSRSRSSRPAAPPPRVPPPTSQTSTMSTSQSSAMTASVCSNGSIGQSGQHGGADDSSFSDLYNDIVNSLSGNKDIPPDLLMKLKDEKPASKTSHYYHKYDVTGTKKKENDGELTLSRALGDKTSSIIIETMNTSFHGSACAGDVEATVTQELTMPYNIVDVSKRVPC